MTSITIYNHKPPGPCPVCGQELPHVHVDEPLYNVATSAPTPPEAGAGDAVRDEALFTPAYGEWLCKAPLKAFDLDATLSGQQGGAVPAGARIATLEFELQAARNELEIANDVIERLKAERDANLDRARLAKDPAP